MDDEQKWSNISSDIADVAKKLKSRIDEEDLVEDLKDTFKTTIDKTSQLINNIIKTVEATVTDEDIKKETKEIVNNKKTIDTKNKLQTQWAKIDDPQLKKLCKYAWLEKWNVYDTEKETENGYKDIDIETFIQIMKEKIHNKFSFILKK